MKVFNKNKALRQIKLKQNKNTYIKRISIVLSCFILLVGIMYFTFAKFEQNSEEYTLINGKVKYLGGDINIVSYNYDGTSNSQPPNKNEGYILTNINCEGATGEWDDVNWELNISSLTNKVKCNLEFDKNSNYQIIKYNPNGGYLEEQYKKGVVGEQIGSLPTPVRTGYTFEGWYKESALTNKVETTTTIDTTITNLYAKYTENTITINTPGESNVLDYAKANFELPNDGGENKNVLIFSDMLLTNNSGASYYNDEYFNYVSGSFRSQYDGTTEIKLTFKKSGKISIYYGGHSSWSGMTLTLNNTSILPSKNYTKIVNVNAEDTLYEKTTPYYQGVTILFNPDLSVMQGHINMQS